MLQKQTALEDDRFLDRLANEPVSSPFDVDRLLSAARRQWVVIATAVALFGIVGLVRAMTAVPLYTATTQILIDKTSAKVVDRYSSVAGDYTSDDYATQSELELIRSQRIAGLVVEKLGLAKDEALLHSRSSTTGSIRSLVGQFLEVAGLRQPTLPVAEGADEAVEARELAIGKLLANVAISRIPRTYVMNLSYTDPDPHVAARIANNWAEIYLTHQLESKYDATRRASVWLGERIDELRQQSIDSDLAVQKFRAQNGLLSTDGALAVDQKLTDLNAQQIAAEADVGQIDARYQQVRSILESGSMDAAVKDSMESGIINSIRTRYLQALKTRRELSAKLTPEHEQVRKLADEMIENRRLMFDELGRIAESLLGEREVAQKRLYQIKTAIAVANQESAAVNETMVELRELERSAQTYRSLYESFLQRYQEAVQHRAFPVAEALIIATADAPRAPSYPSKRSMLMQFLMLGLAIGGGLGAFREYRDRFFRTGDQVRDELGQRFLGFVPSIVDAENALKPLPADQTSPELRRIRKRRTVTNHAVDHPLSSFAETMRAVKVTADIMLDGRIPKVIGVVSCLPGEGKSTISVNLAELLAMQGNKTLLIDADLRNPGITRGLAAHAKAGLVEAVLDDRPLKDLLLLNPATKLALLPAVIVKSLSHSSEILVSAGMDRVLKRAGDTFDYIVLDLPPMAPVVDAVAVAPRIDAFLFVVEWGKTSRRMVRTVLRDDPAVTDKCLGIVLNKANMDQMKYYREYGSKDFYYARVTKYYQDNHGS